MDATVRLRALVPADHAACVALWTRTEGLGDVPPPADLTRFLDRNAGFSRAAEADGLLVGTILAAFDGIRGSLYRLAVDGAWRRRGIGAALVGDATAALRTAGARRINLHVFADNLPALAFWRAQGWSRYERLETWRRDL